MGRRDKINELRDFFRRTFEVRNDGRIIYKRDYTYTWDTGYGLRHKNYFKGDTFGKNKKKSGHWIAYINGVRGIDEHQVSWLLVHEKLPEYPLQIDHLDGNAENNSPENLRAVTQNINQHNQRRAKGYCLDKGKFYVQIRVNNENIRIGRFDTELDARAAYIRAKRKYHPNCGWDIFQEGDNHDL